MRLEQHIDKGSLAPYRTGLLHFRTEFSGTTKWILKIGDQRLAREFGRTGMRLWTEVGGSMIAIDTFVHKLLYRTGILARFKAEHSYGMACYRPGGCAEIIQSVAERIDARQFNPSYPKVFPRLVQHAIWRYCSQSGLDVCNGNRIDDANRCENRDCRVRTMCDRAALH